MLADIGQQIRLLRKNRGFTIQQFAQIMDVSVGYQSNLETGKAETISISFLNKLQEEFSFVPFVSDKTSLDDQFSIRLHHLNTMLRNLQETDPEIVDYYLNHLERGIHLFKKGN
ncbi:helix-turn-helix domain-containing protein [Neobacillus drentensis]|uniref:helix-turn-helix domain-containing protein n=1 Tax=Neobacillus drentensis TaxID=220684 RepID=UPI003000BA29